MTWSAASSIGSLRLVVIGVAGCAVALLLQQPHVPYTPELSALPPANASVGRVWSVRTDGWVLKIDGADVRLPSVPETIARAPKLVFREAELSPFDHVIKRHAASAGFDWQLIAAVIFEESRFDPGSLSPKGAFGLMQVREIAADAVGEYRFKLPEDNVRTGVRYLSHLEDMYADLPARERQRFVLAAYNGGPGHVADARTLADRWGFDRDRWEGGIREALPLLEEERYHGTVSQGYAQGRQIVRYVERVLERYRYYQRLTATAALEQIAAIEGTKEEDGAR